MKKIKNWSRSLIGVIVGLSLFAAVTGRSEVIESVDRFTGTTSYIYEAKVNGPDYDGRLLTPSAAWFGKVYKDKSERYSLLFMAATSFKRGGSWRYLNSKKMDWLVDGQPLVVLPPEYEGDVKNGFVVEIFQQFFTRSQFEQIANAQTVEFRISLDEFKLSQQDIASVKEILSRMPVPEVKPIVPPGAAPSKKKKAS